MSFHSPMHHNDNRPTLDNVNMSLLIGNSGSSSSPPSRSTTSLVTPAPSRRTVPTTSRTALLQKGDATLHQSYNGAMIPEQQHHNDRLFSGDGGGGGDDDEAYNDDRDMTESCAHDDTSLALGNRHDSYSNDNSYLSKKPHREQVEEEFQQEQQQAEEEDPMEQAHELLLSSNSYSPLVEESSKWIRQLETIRNDMNVMLVENAILLDKLTMAGATVPDSH